MNVPMPDGTDDDTFALLFRPIIDAVRRLGTARRPCAVGAARAKAVKMPPMKTTWLRMYQDKRIDGHCML